MPNDPHKAAKPKDKDSSMAKKEAAKVQESQRVELPTAKELMKQIAQKEAEKASEYMRHEAAGQAEKKALIERLSKPSGVSDEEALRRVMAIIQRAASNGVTEVQVLRFPNSLCTDGGRAINNLERRKPANLSSAIRLFVLAYYQRSRR